MNRYKQKIILFLISTLLYYMFVLLDFYELDRYFSISVLYTLEYYISQRVYLIDKPVNPVFISYYFKDDLNIYRFINSIKSILDQTIYVENLLFNIPIKYKNLIKDIHLIEQIGTVNFIDNYSKNSILQYDTPFENNSIFIILDPHTIYGKTFLSKIIQKSFDNNGGIIKSNYATCFSYKDITFQSNKWEIITNSPESWIDFKENYLFDF